MKFHPLEGLEAEKSAVQADYAAGREIGTARLGALYFHFRLRGHVYYIPYGALTRCFRRVELVQARMCCGKGNFEIENIVICGKDEQEIAQIQLPGAKAGKILLEEIAKRAPACAIGKKTAPTEENK